MLPGGARLSLSDPPRSKYHKLKFGTEPSQGEKRADPSEPGTEPSWAWGPATGQPQPDMQSGLISVCWRLGFKLLWGVRALGRGGYVMPDIRDTYASALPVVSFLPVSNGPAEMASLDSNPLVWKEGRQLLRQ